MAIDSILSLIDEEIARLTQVRALLSGAGKIALPVTDRKAANSSARNSAKGRVLSPEARKRIADAQRKRWAAQKAKAK